MHVSSYTLKWLAQRRHAASHEKEGFSPEISCEMVKKQVLPLHYHLDDANIDQALFGPPFYRDIVQESTGLFTLFHLVEKTTGYTRKGRGGSHHSFR